MCIQLPTARGNGKTTMLRMLSESILKTEAERDEARKCAEELRDMLSALDEVTAALPFPWEVEGLDADSNSED